MSIIEEIKAVPSGKKDLRNFGLVMAGAFALIGGVLIWKAKPAAPWLMGIAGVFLVLGLAAPLLLKPIHKVWMALAVVLGWVMTRVILAFTYYLMITPISLLMRLFGHRFLDLRWKTDEPSYWKPRPEKEFDPKQYERQF